MIGSLIAKFLRARWGAILPQVFKAIAEGKAGPVAQQIYWKTARYKTPIGASLWALGAGLETVCGNYPLYAWACTYAAWPYYIGMFLTGLGLADGGTRHQWPTRPDGTPSWQEPPAK